MHYNYEYFFEKGTHLLNSFPSHSSPDFIAKLPLMVLFIFISNHPLPFNTNNCVNVNN